MKFLPGLIFTLVFQAWGQKPAEEIKVGHCSATAFDTVATLSEMNKDGEISSQSGKYIQSLQEGKPKAYLDDSSTESSELWDVLLEYGLRTSKGVIVGRQVTYSVLLHPFKGGFCDIVEVKKILKKDHFVVPP